MNITSRGNTLEHFIPTASTDVATASLSYDTVCAFIATQPKGSQIKYEDITQIDDDDIEEMDIKWNLALLSMRDDRFWKKTGKKITIQGSDVASFDKSKVEWAILLESADHQRVKTEGRKKATRRILRLKSLIAIDGIRVIWLRKMKTTILWLMKRKFQKICSYGQI
ncbi:hypothetical protein Tco_1271789 [Tanacetum coccineum]